MSQNRETEIGRRFLTEALPLIASYFSGESVGLSGTNARVGEDFDAESRQFVDQIRLRHALTCCAALIPIVHRIEDRVSHVNRIVRTETRGVIKGRLDIPRYVARRATSFTWPKTYPILVSEESPSTPENALTARVFRHLLTRLTTSKVPSRSAEAVSARYFKQWISHRIKRDPWRDVATTSSMHRLQMETSRRLERRQTGNESAYLELVKIIAQWHLGVRDFGGSTSSAKFVDALLSFPADEAFLDRVYEIWCVREIAACLIQIGATLVHGPRPMTQNTKSAIYSFDLNGNQIEIWFQRALDQESATWRYELSGKNLRGIPDISVIANGVHFLLVDAKNRLVTGNTRSEETYKMLGYFENFSPILGRQTSWGVLAFISYHEFLQSLYSLPGRKLVMLSANPSSANDCLFRSQFIHVLHDWIACWR